MVIDWVIFCMTMWFWHADKGCPILESDEISNRGSFRSVTTVVCSCLLQMGDDFLVFQMLETVVVDQIVSLPSFPHFRLFNECLVMFTYLTTLCWIISSIVRWFYCFFISVILYILLLHMISLQRVPCKKNFLYRPIFLFLFFEGSAAETRFRQYMCPVQGACCTWL